MCYFSVQKNCTTKLSGFFQAFQDTVHAVRVNETKLISENAFIVDLFALGSEERSQYDKRTFLLGLPMVL